MANIKDMYWIEIAYFYADVGSDTVCICHKRNICNHKFYKCNLKLPGALLHA